MRLTITHTTTYRYDEPVPYALQRLRLQPVSGPGQEVVDWAITATQAALEAEYPDGFGNRTSLWSAHGAVTEIAFQASGVVETSDNAGVHGMIYGPAPLWLYNRETALTAAGKGVDSIVSALPPGEPLFRLHELMKVIGERVTYKAGQTGAHTGAEDAIAGGTGVCQDHTHIFCAAARKLGFPARYVSGYLFMDGVEAQAASHAWAEAHVDGIGWVGFDCSNGISPDERYVRIACGRDYTDAAPVSGIRFGTASESLFVGLNVSQ